MRHALICLLTLILVACFSTSDLRTYRSAKAPENFIPKAHPVMIDGDFSESERALIAQAFEEWNVSLNGYASFGVMDTRASLDRMVSMLDQINQTGQGRIVVHLDQNAMECMEEGTLAYVEDYHAPVIYVCSNVIGLRDLRAIILHEIGHTLGLPHNNVPGNLMYPSYSYAAPCIDEITLRALVAVWPTWRPDNMRACAWGSN